MFRAIPDPASAPFVEEFKQAVARKLSGLSCPRHHQPPRLRFEGTSLRDISIRMSGCCEQLIDLANRKIAE